MADEIRVRNVTPSEPMASTGSSSSSKNPWIILVVVVIVLGILGFLFRDKLMGSKAPTAAEGKSSGYQAVFLTNGQVYFGKLSMTGQYAKLSDIYYLQVTNPPQLQGAGSQTQSQQQPQIQLVKLGNELHGPVDTMSINKDQVLFFEDMKEDGKVMQAIRQDQKTKASGQSNTQQQAPATQQQAPATQQQAPATQQQVPSTQR